MKLYAYLGLACLLVVGSEAINCFTCGHNSAPSPALTGIPLTANTACGKEKDDAAQTTLKGIVGATAATSGTPAVACVACSKTKIVYNSGWVSISRGCVTNLGTVVGGNGNDHKVKDKGASCAEASFSHNKKETYKMCYCKQDYCNSASGLTAGLLSIIMAALFSRFM